MFSAPYKTSDLAWLATLCARLATNGPTTPGATATRIRIVDFSEVPSDILPLTVSLMAEIVLRVKQWGKLRDPITMVCDEAHLYVSEHGGGTDALSALSTATFERIAKEGRKYGIGLLVVTQRPSEVNRTVLSQCNNYIAMRLLNQDDRNVVRGLLPDSLGGFSDLLQLLDVGEALVVGDASLLPSRVRIDEPKHRPNSMTIPFWSEWSKSTTSADMDRAVFAWRKQTISR